MTATARNATLDHRPPSSGGFRPVRILELELSAPLEPLEPAITAERGHGRAMVLVRLHRRPVGLVWFALGEEPLDAGAVAERIWCELSADVNRHLVADGLAPLAELPLAGIDGGRAAPRCILERQAVAATGPFVTVAIATHDRPDLLRACLDSLLEVEYASFEILVVDNAPSSDATRALVQERYGSTQAPAVRYVCEPVPGLAVAHNRALRETDAPIVAFTDDDVQVDRLWLAEIVAGFRDERVACVTGMILPFELETRAQVLLEQYGGFSKGFEDALFDLGEHRPDAPLFPYTAGACGSGANMAFRADALRRMGGFDPAMGAGTPALGGDDLAAFFDVIAAGHTLAYAPGAIVWHKHYREYESLRRQAYGYGVGLAAFLTKTILDRPARLAGIARRLPRGAAYALRPTSGKNAGKGDDYPKELTRLERKGMRHGAWAYVRSRRARRRRERAQAAGGVDAEASSPEDRAGAPEPRVSTATATAGAALALAVILALAVADAAGVTSPWRAVLAFVAALSVPGLAVVLRFRITDAVTALVVVIAGSLAIDTLVGLAMLWSTWWHPQVAGAAVLAATAPIFGTQLARALARHEAGHRWSAARRAAEAAAARLAAAAGADRWLLLATGAALALWAASLTGVDVSRLGDYGLPPELPIAWYLALAGMAAVAAAACSRPTRPLALVVVGLGLVAVLYATIPAVTSAPQYSWVYKHIGVVRLFEARGSVVPNLDIYNHWPGFFAASAWVTTIAGVPDPVHYAAYAEPVFAGLSALLVATAAYALGHEQRLRVGAIAAMLFLVSNWVGQSYFAPQAESFVLSLGIVALLLRFRAPARGRIARAALAVGRRISAGGEIPDGAVARRPPRVVTASVLLAMTAIVPSHQLTPYIVLLSVAGLLVLGSVRSWPLLLAMAVLTLAFLALNFTYVNEHFGVLSSLDPTRNARSVPVVGGSPMPGVDVAARAGRVLTFLMWAAGLGSAVVLARRGRSRLALPLLALMAMPFALFFGQDYGGEAPLRVALFTIPWCCTLLALALAGISARTRALALTAAALGLLTALFVPAFMGLAGLNVVTGDEVRASELLYARAPAGSTAMTFAPGFPTRIGARYALFRGDVEKPSVLKLAGFRHRLLGPADVPKILQTLQPGRGPGYLIFSTSQDRNARILRLTPPGSVPRLEQAIRASPRFCLWYVNPDVRIYETVAGGSARVTATACAGRPAPSR